MANAVNNCDEEESVSDTRERYSAICSELDVDKDAEQEAWDEFSQINMNVTLEGDSLHWLACALYVTCHKSSVIREQLSIELDGIPLGKLLQKVKLSLIHFFQKVRKWLEMGKHGTILNEKIEQLERVFSVSHIVFEKYSAIFKAIYKEDWAEQIKRGRKKQAMGTKEIFNFCWTLYICTKAQYPDISDDLVNSYHLLLCCLDLTFSNTLSVKPLKGAIQTNFKGAPPNYFTTDYSTAEIPSIIDILCQINEGLPIETKIIRTQHLGSFVEELLKNNKLKGNTEKKTGMLDVTNFDSNLKYLNESYEKHILRISGIDERIFIKEDSISLIGTPTKRMTAFTESDDKGPMQFQLKRNLQDCFNAAKGFVPQTPLTGKQWLNGKNEGSADMSITLSVSRLQELVKGLKPTPSEKLSHMMKELKENPEEKVKAALKTFSESFLEECRKPTDDSISEQASSDEPSDFAKTRLYLAVVLFYKTLENFLDAEVNQRKSSADLSALLVQEMFLKCLFTCCLEIVVFSYKSSKVFPWILKAYNLKPYHFFKIIELVIRSEDLSREVIKHLSRVEEQILESLSWESDSPIFAAIETHGVPRCAEVSTEGNFSTPLLFMSPTNVRMNKDTLQQSPLSLAMRGGNKMCTTTPASPARRNLFGSTVKSEPAVASITNNKATTAVILPPKSTVSATPTCQFPIMLASPGQSPIRLFAVTPQRGTPQTGIIRITSASPSKAASKKYGSLGIFFRKLYHLASVRLKDLCENLGIGSELQKKIWTCFEHSLTENIDMLQDRHIDQLIMCAVYVIAKVTKEEKSFHEIMKWYRTQPQAHSDVYRRVLIKKTKTDIPSPTEVKKMDLENNPDTTNEKETKSSETEKSEKSESPEKTDKPEEKSDSKEEKEKSTVDEPPKEESEPCEEKYVYNDLIQFYNIVYIKKIKEFALKFATNKVTPEALSPLPVTRKQVHSPRKLSKQHQIFISPIKPAPNMTPRSKMLFCFDSDTPKKLGEINAMIKGSTGTRRRVNLDDEVGGGPTPPKRPLNGIAKRAQELRQEQMNRPINNAH